MVCSQRPSRYLCRPCSCWRRCIWRCMGKWIIGAARSSWLGWGRGWCRRPGSCRYPCIATGIARPSLRWFCSWLRGSSQGRRWRQMPSRNRTNPGLLCLSRLWRLASPLKGVRTPYRLRLGMGQEFLWCLVWMPKRLYKYTIIHWVSLKVRSVHLVGAWGLRAGSWLFSRIFE